MDTFQVSNSETHSLLTGAIRSQKPDPWWSLPRRLKELRTGTRLSGRVGGDAGRNSRTLGPVSSGGVVLRAAGQAPLRARVQFWD